MRRELASMCPSGVAVGRSVKSDGQLSSSDFTEGLLSEVAMTCTGRLPSPEPLSEAVWPHVARLPSPSLPIKLLSEVRRPHAAQFPSLKPPTKLHSDARRPTTARLPSIRLFSVKSAGQQLATSVLGHRWSRLARDCVDETSRCTLWLVSWLVSSCGLGCLVFCVPPPR